MIEAVAKKARGTREGPLFYKEINREYKDPHIKMESLIKLDPNEGDYTSLFMCPYTPLIPLSYLGHNTLNYDEATIHKKKWKWGIPSKVLSRLLEYTSASQNDTASEKQSSDKDTWIGLKRSHAWRNIRKYLDFDEMINFRRTLYSICNNTGEALPLFRNPRVSSIRMRTYSGYIGSLSLVAGNNPHIMACIIPENLEYHKYNILLDREIDTSRIIVLVDNQLDSYDFPLSGLRNLYKKELEPFLRSTKAQIWKVPLSYIQQNCFVQPFRLDSRKPSERREELARLVDEFCRIGAGEKPQPPTIEEEKFHDQLRHYGISSYI